MKLSKMSHNKITVYFFKYLWLRALPWRTSHQDDILESVLMTVKHSFVFQRTSPYTSPRGKVVPDGLILEQSVPLTDGTQICMRGEDSVRRQIPLLHVQQQSGGWI